MRSFKIYGIWPQADIHKCSHASVGLAQVRPNKLPYNSSTTVIHFIFIVKIFLCTENVRKYFTRINFTTKIFSDVVWLPDFTKCCYPYIMVYIASNTNRQSSFHQPSLRHAGRSPQLRSQGWL